MSKRKSGLNIHGILLLDKRLGVSSNRALQEVRRLFNANKAGHTGSLDPLATGLLPLCFGEATKVSALMLASHKRYEVEIQLGILTDTGDLEGQIIDNQPIPELSVKKLTSCLTAFSGEMEQVPPMYSALKHQGKKLYELAREGITVERKPRKITLFELKLLSFSNETLTLEVFCSKGTYIRSLAEDIGQYLNTVATVKALRRLQAGQFIIEESYTFEQLAAMDTDSLQRCLLAVDNPLMDYPRVELSEFQAKAICQGQTINTKYSSLGKIRMYNQHSFLGLGELSATGKLAPKKIFNLS
ncbi:MAG: tRNA pseudouridine(55) synthase TruB [Methylococcales bacterium]|nr:tRNA pseudouridine(55) synthase TruB [Methylococcales bacterium]